MNSSAVNHAWKWQGMNGRNSELSFHAEFEFPFGLVGRAQQVIWIWVSVRKSKNKLWTGCCCLVTLLCPTLCDPMDCSSQASLSFSISWSLLKLTSIQSVMLSNHLILCCPLLLLPSVLPSIWVFSNESVLHIRWPKYWNFSFTKSVLLYGPTLTSIHDYWKNHSFNYTDFCWQWVWCLCFLICYLGLS